MCKTSLRDSIASFRKDRRATVGIIFGLAVLPLMLLLGVAVDYQRATVTKSRLQAALDAAVIAASAQPESKRLAVATTTFNAQKPTSNGVSSATASFQPGATGYSGTATAAMPTAIMKIAHIDSLTVSASSAAAYATTTGWGNCFVALANGLSAGADAFTLNGAPNMDLAGCNIMSNASMRCNGHDGNAPTSKAVGTVSGCTNPVPNAPAYADPYTALASNIVAVCSGAGGVTWTPGTLPSGPNFITVARSGYTEYHVCGNLTMSGSGDLTSAASVIVIENGSLTMGSKANVTATDTTFVLTGANTANHYIDFPNGAGQLATLTVRAPTSSANPWRGIAIYVDPALTQNVDNSFGPGASLVFDGVVYMPHTNLTFHGNTGSAAGNCSILIVDTFTSNGSGSITFAQSESACVNAGVAKKVNARITH
jgi:Flp pilus assembly protein TadG